MRIRTIKPEFWQHEAMSSLPAFTRLMALALLNWADDEGYFLASTHLIRGALFPFDDDSTKIHRALVELSNTGWIRLGKDGQGRQIGHVVTFDKHQKIDRLKPSKIKASATFDEDSTIPQRPVEDPSLLEWNRDQGKGNGISPSIPQGGSTTQDSPSPQPEKPKPDASAGPKAGSDKPKKKKGGAAEAIRLVLPAHWSQKKRDALQEWLAYKVEQYGHHYKPLGFAKLVKSLEDRSEKELCAAVDLAMSKTWMGLVFDDERAFPASGGQAEKKEGGAADAGPSRGTEAPQGWQRAMTALWGEDWKQVYAAWALMPPADQRQVRSWLAAEKKEGGGR